MSRRATFLVYQAEQPNEAAWNAALAFANAWNARSPTYPLAVAFMAIRTFAIDVAHPDYTALRTELAALAQTQQVVFLEDIEESVESADIAAADFVGMFGAGIESFIVRSDLGPELPCPTCGSRDGWMAPPRSAFVVDDSALVAPGDTSAGMVEAQAGGWELVNLPDGGVAVSQRVLELLRTNGATGWETRPLVLTTGGTSRMAQLLARTFIAVPCPHHPDAEASSVCPTCGVVLDGRLEMGWHVRRAAITDLTVFSRHPFLAAELFVRRTLYEALVAAGIAGIEVTITARLCDHTG